MSLFITSLNSGSNGNCYYIGNSREAILVDAGISCREIEKRMKRLGLKIEKIKAVFVSHEHIDHIKGLCVFLKKYPVPVYITAPTFNARGFSIKNDLVRTFREQEAVLIGELSVTAFRKQHDACDPYSFVISCNKIRVGVFTDIGEPCQNVIKHFKQCHAAFLEANFDDRMLDGGNYPYYLKQRIRGGKGHLSNGQALGIFTIHKPAFMTHLLLSHLSNNNNCPDLVQKIFNEKADGVKIIVASRFIETAVYHIQETSRNKIMSSSAVLPSQLEFSFV